MQNTKPKLEKLRGGLFPKYRLLKDYRFEFQYAHRRAYMVVPAGFEYDGATGGSFLFTRKSMHEEGETTVHDYGYLKLGNVGARYLNHVPLPELSKKQLDDIFLQGARCNVNVQNWRVALASLAFKTIGRLMWKRREIFG